LTGPGPAVSCNRKISTDRDLYIETPVVSRRGPYKKLVWVNSKVDKRKTTTTRIASWKSVLSLNKNKSKSSSNSSRQHRTIIFTHSFT